jgi:hypothetical protein
MAAGIVRDAAVMKINSSVRQWIEVDLLADEPSELLGCLHGLQAAVEPDRGVYVPVPKQPPYGFIVPGPVLKIDRRR